MFSPSGDVSILNCLSDRLQRSLASTAGDEFINCCSNCCSVKLGTQRGTLKERR